MTVKAPCVKHNPWALILCVCGISIGGFSQTAKPPHSVATKTKDEIETPIPESILAWDASVKEYIASPKDKEAFFVFNVTNVSLSPITFVGVTTSCGCTVAKLPSVPWTLGPGTNGQIHATMKLAGRNGIVMKSVTLQTDRGEKLLFVRVNIPIPANP